MAHMYEQSILGFDLDLLLSPQASKTTASDQSYNINPVCFGKSPKQTGDIDIKKVVADADAAFVKYYSMKEENGLLQSALSHTKSNLLIISEDLTKTKEKLKDRENELLKLRETHGNPSEEVLKRHEKLIHLMLNKHQQQTQELQKTHEQQTQEMVKTCEKHTQDINYLANLVKTFEKQAQGMLKIHEKQAQDINSVLTLVKTCEKQSQDINYLTTLVKTSDKQTQEVLKINSKQAQHITSLLTIVETLQKQRQEMTIREEKAQEMLKAREEQTQVDRKFMERLDKAVTIFLNKAEILDNRQPVKDLLKCYRLTDPQTISSKSNQSEIHIITSNNQLPITDIKKLDNIFSVRRDNDLCSLSSNENTCADTGCGSSLALTSDEETRSTYFSMNNSPLNTDITDKTNRVFANAATSPLPFYHIDVATSPIQCLKSVDITKTAIQEINISDSINSNNNNEITTFSQKTDMAVKSSLTNNSVMVRNKNTIGNNAMYMSSLVFNENPLNNNEMNSNHTLSNSLIPDKRSLQMNKTRNYDNENCDTEIQMILNEMRFTERMITPIPPTPVNHVDFDTLKVFGRNFDCGDTAALAEQIYDHIVRQSNFAISEVPGIQHNKGSSLDITRLQNHINPKYEITDGNKIRKAHLYDNIILNSHQNSGNHCTDICNPINKNIQGKVENKNESKLMTNKPELSIFNSVDDVHESKRYNALNKNTPSKTDDENVNDTMSSSRPEMLTVNSADDIDETHPKNKYDDLYDCDKKYTCKVLKQRKLTKLDKLRKRLTPKSKIRVTSPPIKKLRKKGSHLLIPKTLEDKEITAKLKNKNALDNAIRVMTEIKRHQNSIENKQCYASLNNIDLRTRNSCQQNEIVTKSESTCNMAANKTQNANKSKLEVQILEDILLTNGNEIKVEKNNSNNISYKLDQICMSPNLNNNEKSTCKNVILSESLYSPLAITIHRDGNVDLQSKLSVTESNNSVSKINKSEKKVLSNILTDQSKINIQIDQKVIGCPVSGSSMFPSTADFQNTIITRSKSKSPEFNTMHNEDTTNRTNIPQVNNENNSQKIRKLNNAAYCTSQNEKSNQSITESENSADIISNTSNGEDNKNIRKRKQSKSNDEPIQKTRKRKNSFDKPVIECKRMLRSSTLRMSRSDEQCLKFEDSTNNNIVQEDKESNIELSRKSRSRNSSLRMSESDDHKIEKCSDIKAMPKSEITDQPVAAVHHNSVIDSSKKMYNISSNIQTKDSILCIMLDKYGKKSGKNCNKNISEDIILTISKTIHEEILKIISVSGNEAKQYIRKFIFTMQNYKFKHFMEGLMQYLKDSQRKLELYKQMSSPNSPPMTKAEKALLCILIHFSVTSVHDVIGSTLDNIEHVLFKLNRTPEFDTVESMSHFYAVVCTYFGFVIRLRKFMLDAMYCIKFKAMSVVKQCLIVCKNVLPKATTQLGKSSLVLSMVYLLHFYKCNDPFNTVQEIRNILSKTYYYEIKHWNEPKLLQMLKTAVINVKAIPLERKLLRMALIVVAKRHGPEWCNKNLINKLLIPIIENESNVEHLRNFCIMMLGPLMKPFPENMKVHSEIVINKLVQMLNQCPTSTATAEAIASTLVYLSKYSMIRIVQILLRWHPTRISADFENQMKDFVSEKPLKVWNSILYKAIHF
ncbi:hypothetical protein ACJJTC_009922 [Scirpophaga incertulas]